MSGTHYVKNQCPSKGSLMVELTLFYNTKLITEERYWTVERREGDVWDGQLYVRACRQKGQQIKQEDTATFDCTGLGSPLINILVTDDKCRVYGGTRYQEKMHDVAFKELCDMYAQRAFNSLYIRKQLLNPR